MKFLLLRRFSHLIHRRTRSDSAVAGLSLQSSERDNFSHSLSLGDLVQLGEYSRYPNLAPPPTENHAVASDFLLVSGTSENPSIAIFYVEQRINQLQKEHAQLQASHGQLKAQIDLKSEELYSYNTRIASLNHSISKLNVVIEAAKQELVSLGNSINHLDQSLVIHLDVAVCGPVFHRTRSAISFGSVFMDAIVDAIREAAEVPHSPWSTLIPPIIGPRSQDHYMSALSITLKTRSDLRRTKNIARYWKSSAKEDENHEDVITPSASTLSEVQETLTAERQKAVDALWSKLKSGELPLRSTIVTQARENIPDHPLTMELPVAPSFVNASSLFMPPNPQTIKHQITASAAASIVTVNASLMHSSSGESLPSTQSAGGSFMAGSAPSSTTQLESEEPTPPLPPLSSFSADFWAAAHPDSGNININNGPTLRLSQGSDPTMKDALQSLELIRTRFNNMRLDTINEARPTDPTNLDCQETHPPCVPPESTFTSEDEVSSSNTDECDDLEAGFVFVSIPTSTETPSPKRRNSLLQSLNLSSRIPRRLPISLSPTKLKSKSSTRIGNAGSKTFKEKNLASISDSKDIRKRAPAPTASARSPLTRKFAITVRTVSEGCAASSLDAKHGQGVSYPSATCPPSTPTISSSRKHTDSTSPLRSTNSVHSKSSGTVLPSTRMRAAVSSKSTRFMATNNRDATLSAPSRPATSKPKTEQGSLLTKENQSTYRSRLPVQHHRPPPPVPTAKGKENFVRDVVVLKRNTAVEKVEKKKSKTTGS
ncbi:hypothetical protein F5050DRAFT_1805162 [Lentinula boryana]|uniref:Uncharacterized protein n=1 Tax=Lentinula boryana TaxID=40481 RepID=A0ABQ8QLQ0_9AGAR|nr:hypothetical protein F5050DRAFT_1805162 [Lentinula boryana]